MARFIHSSSAELRSFGAVERQIDRRIQSSGHAQGKSKLIFLTKSVTKYSFRVFCAIKKARTRRRSNGEGVIPGKKENKKLSRNN